MWNEHDGKAAKRKKKEKWDILSKARTGVYTPDPTYPGQLTRCNVGWRE